MGTITIAAGGRLVFDATSPTTLTLSANMVELTGGEFWIGSEDCPYTGDAEVLLTGTRDESEGAPGVQKAVVVHQGVFEVHGQPKLMENKELTAFAAICHIGFPENSVEAVGTVSNDRSQTGLLVQRIGDVEFAAMSVVSPLREEHANRIEAVSYPAGGSASLERVLKTVNPVDSWKVGDRIVLASTDFDYNQAEEFEILECDSCTTNEVKIMGPVLYTHWGEVTDGVDMRAEVGVLTRNVRFHGRMEESCYGNNLCDIFDYDTFGGQIKIHQNFTSVRIENAEFYHMGQQSVMSSYPIHFHMCLDTSEKDAYVRNNSIHHTFSRCVTVHGTHNLTVEGNIAYHHLGHCYFVEDGGEQHNQFIGNLGLSTQPGTLLPTDGIDQVSTFWIASPNNILINNRAAGSEGIGVWFLLAYFPTGHSAKVDMGLEYGFKANALRGAGAIGKKLFNEYFTSPISSVRNVTFDFADPDEGSRFFDGDGTVRGFKERDGNRHNIVLDVDGSLTTVAGTSVVRPLPLLLNARCVLMPTWGPGTALCPDRFIRLNFDRTWRVPTFMTRDDLMSSATETPLAKKQISYSLNTHESYILHFNTTVPHRFKLTPYGLEQGLQQVLGVCVGVKKRFKVIPATYKAARSREEVLADDNNTKYFYDSVVGVITFRLTHPYPRGASTLSHCPGVLDENLNGFCDLDITIIMRTFSDDGDCRQRAYPAYQTPPVTADGALTVPVFQ
ncbi:Cell surface hyaluronidase [Amphibalanus amphitrite]|uniref:Cell surface hyaluronidase n=1 Tax=Amphibalanus amphitrite TaxID=1232801 RepID=A0A6A4W4Y1_AMPAM|nr:Cell surface hyaluronidase [Amphibalanus amphitrite]